MSTGDGGDRRSDRTGRSTGRLEPTADDAFDGGEVERTSLDEVGLCIERLGPIGEQHLHGRGLRPGEQQPDLLEVVLQRRAQLGGRTVDADDAGELVDHQHDRLALRRLDDDVELRLDDEQRVRPLLRRLAQLHGEHAEREIESGGQLRDVGRPDRADLGERSVDSTGEVGPRGERVEVEPHRGDRVGQPIDDRTQCGGLAVSTRSEQRRDPPLTHSPDEVVDQLVLFPVLVRFERTVMRKRRGLHAIRLDRQRPVR